MRRNNIEYKNATQLGYMREAALIVNQIHDALRKAAKPGVSLLELDRISADVITSNDATSNFFGYYDYPATVCISVNDTVVHGIPNDYRLRDGDLVSFDCGCFIMRDGSQWHGDSAFSMIIGDKSAAPDYAEKLERLTYESMVAGIAALDSGRTVGVVGDAVEAVVAEGALTNGWEAGIVEQFIGHGIGTAMHQDPEVLNYSVRGRQPKLAPGMVICVEPILTKGSAAVKTLGDGWTVKTVSGDLACHWECQVAIVEGGISVLNQPDWGQAMLAPYNVQPVALK